MRAVFSVLRASSIRIGLLATLGLAPFVLQAHDLEICKVSDPLHPVSGSFTFDVEVAAPTDATFFTHFVTKTVLAGACTEAFTGDGDGPYRITEIATTNTALTDVKSKIVYNYSTNLGGTGLIDFNLAQGSALVYARGAATTIVTFTNSGVTIANQGCTPGYFKQSQHFDSWIGLTPATLVSSVFPTVDTSLAGETLLQALQGGGGAGILGAEQILIRAAVAALLNASTVNYPLTIAAIKADVKAALDTGSRDAILTLATTLDNYNNGSAGCPLN